MIFNRNLSPFTLVKMLFFRCSLALTASCYHWIQSSVSAANSQSAKSVLTLITMPDTAPHVRLKRKKSDPYIRSFRRPMMLRNSDAPLSVVKVILP